MKISGLSKIQIAVFIIGVTVLSPVILIHYICIYMNKPCIYLLDLCEKMFHSFGNKLLQSSDEVKEGAIKDKQLINRLTACSMNEILIVDEDGNNTHCH